VQLGRLADGATIIPLRQGEEETLGHLWRKSIGIPQGSATPLVSTVVRRGIRPPCRRERTIMALTGYANGCTKGITCTRCHGYLIGDQWDACGASALKGSPLGTPSKRLDGRHRLGGPKSTFGDQCI
jgi:hypothetical protein